MNSAEALEKLKQGNARFVSGRAEVSGRVDPVNTDLAAGQTPYAIILAVPTAGCRRTSSSTRAWAISL